MQGTYLLPYEGLLWCVRSAYKEQTTLPTYLPTYLPITFPTEQVWAA
jgi:hypothetical protein